MVISLKAHLVKMSRKERLTADKIESDKFILEVGEKKTIEYKSDSGQKGSCDYIPIKYEQSDGKETPVYIQLGGQTQATKEDPHKNCLTGTLRHNRFRKSDRSPPYTLVVAPRDRDDPEEDEEFKKLESTTNKLRHGVLTAVCGERSLSKKYASVFKTPEECKSNMLSYLCRYPRKDGGAPDTSRAPYYVVDVFGNTRFDLITGFEKDEKGKSKPIKKEIDKRKLITGKEDDVIRKFKFYGEARYPKLTSTGDRLAMKGSLSGMVICDIKEEKVSSSKVDDLVLSNKEAIESNKGLEDTINRLKIAPQEEEQPSEEQSKSPRSSDEDDRPSQEGEMANKEEHGNPSGVLGNAPEY